MPGLTFDAGGLIALTAMIGTLSYSWLEQLKRARQSPCLLLPWLRRFTAPNARCDSLDWFVNPRQQSSPSTGSMPRTWGGFLRPAELPTSSMPTW
jgi:hypothetical protein